jgi:hypothetical protein
MWMGRALQDQQYIPSGWSTLEPWGCGTTVLPAAKGTEVRPRQPQSPWPQSSHHHAIIIIKSRHGEIQQVQVIRVIRAPCSSAQEASWPCYKCSYEKIQLPHTCELTLLFPCWGFRVSVGNPIAGMKHNRFFTLLTQLSTISADALLGWRAGSQGPPEGLLVHHGRCQCIAGQ